MIRLKLFILKEEKMNDLFQKNGDWTFMYLWKEKHKVQIIRQIFKLVQ